MLDLAYLLGVLALFAVLGLAARGVEKLGPRAGSDPRDTRTGGVGR